MIFPVMAYYKLDTEGKILSVRQFTPEFFSFKVKDKDGNGIY
jgi:hypothetical protein